MTPEDEAKWVADTKARNMQEAQELVDNFVYVKNAKTGLCYGYSWGEHAHSPALLQVPCELVDLTDK